MKAKLLTLHIICLLAFSPLSLFDFSATAQTLPVGDWVTEDAFRRQQLMGALDESVTFSVRPLSPVQAFGVQNAFDPDSLLLNERWTTFDGSWNTGWEGWTGSGLASTLNLLHLQRYTQYVSDHPYSLNDGAMIPAAGVQSLTRFGIYGEIGFFLELGDKVERLDGDKVEQLDGDKVERLKGGKVNSWAEKRHGAALRKGISLSFQLQPEWVSAQNKPFDGFPVEQRTDIWEQYWQFHSRIDWPEQFGDGPYAKMSWGQSHVRVNAGPVSAGVSNENLWWGPGRQNAIIMTNTAPGFKHWTFNTSRPIKTPVGAFEFQLIGGKLEASGIRRQVPDSTNAGFLDYYNRPYKEDSVYLNGVVLTYQPRFLPGFHLGFSRVFQTYYTDLDTTSIKSYFPVILPLAKVAEGEEGTNSANQNQLLSVFARYVLPESHAEMYVEFGRDDHAWDLRDLFLEPFHSRAYLIGFRKVVPFKNPNAGALEVAFEHTQLQNSSSGLYRSTGPWYLHSQIRQGYTHQGQMLGAGIGPGGNMQTIEFSYLFAAAMPRQNGPAQRPAPSDALSLQRGQIGLRFDRLVHNNDFHYLAIKDVRKHWVDWNIGLFGNVSVRNFQFYLRADFITSENYQHYYEPSKIVHAWWNPGVQRFNFVGALGITYRF